ncbi:hypothetical protein JCM10213_007088 [Rhodosporidiobolus nylandii]
MYSSFAAQELSLALAEIPWGMRASRLLPATPANEARAEVELLEEGQLAVVACTGKGWIVADTDGGCLKPSTVFDTLDDLMLAVSPAFEAKRMEKLFEKLAAVAEQQNGEENGEGDA